MKPYARQRAILDYLLLNGKTPVDTLATLFNTTGATIRKDLTILENEQKVLRTYGSVVPVTNDELDLPLTNKTNINLQIKKKIAQAAVQLIDEGDSMIMDAGSTVLQMVPFLSALESLTIMTNSLHIINSLANLNKNYSLLMCGGTFRSKSGSFHGNLAESTFEQFSFDKLFIGADGFDVHLGSTTFNEVHGVSKSMCKAAKQIILLTDSSKFNRKSPNIVCPLNKINTIITDTRISDNIHQQLLNNGIKIILVENK
ncbi:transcriptional regulator [Mergibacter septicus]|uniref:Transcriptional regulator n=1 Tax=Mergibacter septicus TaxID=221402 RepID=A0A8E3S977_9PAST|nr:DNA-binding transcriptional repressor [Mergibacter septicus]AWX16276.1 transcriptional regulator [Mergibacter septicus]QDJ15528.1 transcriptional regulator [Mergibacter septicus]UTU48902.1 DNA-binding transcriptional repressor [Mergibacter septicus]WMR96799.1 DNA-binding transcriptional repressor [Mergibacter septicus]